MRQAPSSSEILGVQVKMDELSHGSDSTCESRDLQSWILTLHSSLYSHSIVDGGFELMS